jgi:hypothetical protein
MQVHSTRRQHLALHNSRKSFCTFCPHQSLTCILSMLPPAQLRSDLEAESAERAKRLAAQIAQQREERLRQEVRKSSIGLEADQTARHNWHADHGGSRLPTATAIASTRYNPLSSSAVHVGGLACGRCAEGRDCCAHQEFVATLVRQRDMFRQLFEQLSGRQGGDGGGGAPRGAAAGAPVANGHAGGAAAAGQVLPVNPALSAAKYCLKSNSMYTLCFYQKIRQIGLLTQGGEDAAKRHGRAGGRLVRKSLSSEIDTSVGAGQLQAADRGSGDGAGACEEGCLRARGAAVGGCTGQGGSRLGSPQRGRPLQGGRVSSQPLCNYRIYCLGPCATAASAT